MEPVRVHSSFMLEGMWLWEPTRKMRKDKMSGKVQPVCGQYWKDKMLFHVEGDYRRQVHKQCHLTLASPQELRLSRGWEFQVKEDMNSSWTDDDKFRGIDTDKDLLIFCVSVIGACMKVDHCVPVGSRRGHQMHWKWMCHGTRTWVLCKSSC